MRDTILYDSAMRLFGDHVSPQLLAAAESGFWPAKLWEAVSETGYLDVLADGTGGMIEAVAILRAAGHRAAPIPLPETMLARWLCGATRIGAPAGALSIAMAETGEPLIVPWGRSANAVAIVKGSALCLARPEQLRFKHGASLAGEARDVLTATEAEQSAPLPHPVSADRVRCVGALMRAAQMAGTMEAALDLATRYANDRVQFGRPIGKFQAIPAATRAACRRGGGRAGCRRKRRCHSSRGAPVGRVRDRRREDPGRRSRRHGRRNRAPGARRDRLHRGTLFAFPDPAVVVA